MKMQATIFILFGILLFSSCSSSRQAGWSKQTESISLSKKETKQLQREALAHWKQRHIKAELEQSLEKFEKLVKASTAPYKYMVYLTRGYYFLADAHFEDMELKKKFWEMGISWGEKAMATNRFFEKAMKNGESLSDNLALLTSNEIEAIYWSAANLGKWATNSGITAKIKYKNRVKSMIATVQRMNGGFFFGATGRYWGAYYAIAPSFAGGDMRKSKSHFDRSLEVAPEYLGTKVLYAHYYLIKKGKKEEFKQTLESVLKANGKAKKELIPENIVEKAKARKLLAQIENLF